jgi:hypothetical protein
LITHGVSLSCHPLDCICTKPSNELTALSEPTVIHQISCSSVHITPSNGPIIVHPDKMMRFFSPTVSLNNALTTSVPTTTTLLQTDLACVSLKPSSLD